MECITFIIKRDQFKRPLGPCLLETYYLPLDRHHRLRVSGPKEPKESPTAPESRNSQLFALRQRIRLAVNKPTMKHVKACRNDVAVVTLHDTAQHVPNVVVVKQSMAANIWTELLITVDYSAVADICGVHVEIHILLFAVLHSPCIFKVFPSPSCFVYKIIPMKNWL